MPEHQSSLLLPAFLPVLLNGIFEVLNNHMRGPVIARLQVFPKQIVTS